MMSNQELDNLRERLKDVIINTCNTVGCKDCDLKWGDECSATDLQNKIMKIEFSDLKSKSEE